jgi:serine/threonine-protein kinase HipA
MMPMEKTFRDQGLLQPGQYTRLAPLYDILSTIYYPDLSKKMAMEIGGEYSSEEIIPKHFEKMAEETGLTKPLVKQRISEIVSIILSKIPEIDIVHPVSEAVGALIHNRCERVLNKV